MSVTRSIKIINFQKCEILLHLPLCLRSTYFDGCDLIFKCDKLHHLVEFKMNQDLRGVRFVLFNSGLKMQRCCIFYASSNLIEMFG